MFGFSRGKWPPNIYVSILFLGFGLVMFYGLGVRPYLNYRSSRNWDKVPCVIESSKVTSHRSRRGGTRYKPLIIYRYNYNQAEYKSEEFDFFDQSSGREFTNARQQLPARKQGYLLGKSPKAQPGSTFTGVVRKRALRFCYSDFRWHRPLGFIRLFEAAK